MLCALVIAVVARWSAALPAAAPAGAAPESSVHDTNAPTGLLVDMRPHPAVGVSARPVVSWVVPHLLPPANNKSQTRQQEGGEDETNQLQSSYQLQVFTLPTGGLDDCDKSLMRHDSGRQPSGRSANVDLLASAAAGGGALLPGASLRPGTAYTWRVRVWTRGRASSGAAAGAILEGEGLASAWARGRFTTALFDGWAEAAHPIWLAGAGERGTPAAIAGAAAAPPAPSVASGGGGTSAVQCDLSGLWKGNGNGGKGVPITIKTAAHDAAAQRRYVAHCQLWTNQLCGRSSLLQPTTLSWSCLAVHASWSWALLRVQRLLCLSVVGWAQDRPWQRHARLRPWLRASCRLRDPLQRQLLAVHTDQVRQRRRLVQGGRVRGGATSSAGAPPRPSPRRPQPPHLRLLSLHHHPAW
jgi:hypothetical protein